MEVGKKYIYPNGTDGIWTCEHIVRGVYDTYVMKGPSYVILTTTTQGWVEVKEPRKAYPRYVGVYEASDKQLQLSSTSYMFKDQIKNNLDHLVLIDIIEINYTEKV